MQKEAAIVCLAQVKMMSVSRKQWLSQEKSLEDNHPHGLEILQALLQPKYERQAGSTSALNSRDNGTLTQWYLAHPIHLNSFLPKTQ
jgi:hypothetical protein